MTGSPEPQQSNKLKFPRLVFYNGLLLETKEHNKIQLKMKTFRLVGMALFAVLMCVNFASCSSSDDDPTEEKEGGVVVSGKKLAKIVGTSENSSETITFSYDNKGRLIKSVVTEEHDIYRDNRTHSFIWGDDAIKETVNSSYSYNGQSPNNSSYSNTYTLKNGLVQSDESHTYSYNNSKKLVQVKTDYYTTTAIWDGDKLVSISEDDGSESEATLTYGKSCKKGYFPFAANMIDDCALYIAHPEIAGGRTTQLPTGITWTYRGYGGTEIETSTLEYEFDKEGYITKITGKETDSDGATSTYTYTLTWE